MVRCGALWCVVVRCGVLWCVVVQCAVVIVLLSLSLSPARDAGKQLALPTRCYVSHEPMGSLDGVAVVWMQLLEAVGASASQFGLI